MMDDEGYILWLKHF